MTLQPDGIVAFRLYESSTSPVSAKHLDQKSQLFFASGRLTSDSTFAVIYTDIAPDYGTINRDGSVALNLTGTNGGKIMPFGQWIFATAYHGGALNPAPRVDSISPASVPDHSGDVSILINGSSFLTTSVASLGSSDLSTTYISGTQLKATIPAWMLSNAGAFQILVTNPAPGGGTYYYHFPVTRPIPTISAITPNTVAAGSVLYGITITGGGFDASTTVTLNGISRTAQLNPTATALYVPMNAADVANADTMEVALVNPPPGGGTSVAVPFIVTGPGVHMTSEVVAPVAATQLVADPALPVVYAGLDATDPTHPNSIVALDGATGKMLWSFAAGGAPNTLAISADGQYLYFATDSIMHRASVATKSIDLTFPMANNSACRLLPSGILVSPDDPHAIIVERRCTNTFGGDVTMFDDSVQRGPSDFVANLSPQVYAYGASSSVLYGFAGSWFVQISLSASGPTTRQSVSLGSTSFQSPEALYLNGKLYLTEGVVLDPIAHTRLSSLPNYPPVVYSIAASQDQKALYVLTSGRQTLAAFDLTHGTSVGELPIPGPVVLRRHLVRWGTDGIAFISGNITAGGNVYLVRTDLVHQ